MIDKNYYGKFRVVFPEAGKKLAPLAWASVRAKLTKNTLEIDPILGFLKLFYKRKLRIKLSKISKAVIGKKGLRLMYSEDGKKKEVILNFGKDCELWKKEISKARK